MFKGLVSFLSFLVQYYYLFRNLPNFWAGKNLNSQFTSHNS